MLMTMVSPSIFQVILVFWFIIFKKGMNVINVYDLNDDGH